MLHTHHSRMCSGDVAHDLPNAGGRVPTMCVTLEGPGG